MKAGFYKTIRITGTSLAVTIPPEIKQLLELKKGMFVFVTIEKMKKGVNK